MVKLVDEKEHKKAKKNKKSNSPAKIAPVTSRIEEKKDEFDVDEVIFRLLSV